MTDCRDFQRQLTPLVDGEPTADDRRDLDTHARECPACRADAEAEQQARELVRRRAGRLVPEAPAALLARCAAARDEAWPAVAARVAPGVRRWVPLSLAATLLLAVAGAFLISLNSPVAAVATQLTLDHLKCFALSDGGAQATADANEVAAVVTRVCGRPVAVPDDQPADGLRLVGARRCFSTDGQVAHVLYELGGHPVSLFVRSGESRDDRKFEIMGHQTRWWSQGGATYALVSRAADGRADAAAAVLQRAIH